MVSPKLSAIKSFVSQFQKLELSKQLTNYCKEINMIIPTPTKPCLLRENSCSSAEIETHVNKTNPAEPVICQKRRLVFNENVVVRTIEHINDKTDEEILATWYKKSDYRAMKKEFAMTLRAIADGSYKGDCENHCARGIEFRSKEGSQRRKMNKFYSLVSVLDEQERQREENDESPEALSCVYVEANRRSRKEAQKFGDLDAQEALRVYSGQESLTVVLQQETLQDDSDSNRSAKSNKVGSRIGRIFKRKDSRQKPIRQQSPLRR